MHPALGLPIAYLAGSIPSAYLAGRILKGVDLRKMGSGNLGATNVYRTLGAAAAIVVLLVDAAKGAVPVLVLPQLLDAGAAGGDTALWWALGYGAAAIAGHAKPIFLLWKGGGKGVATASGVFAVLVPGAIAITTAICAVVVWSTGYMSVGSIVAAIVFPILVAFDRGTTSPVFVASVVICAFIVWTHRTNVRRLREGTEHRFSREHEDTP